MNVIAIDRHSPRLGLAVVLSAAVLTGCGGSGSSGSSSSAPSSGPSSAPETTYTIGGTLSGLSASGLTLTNGSQSVSPASGATTFTFPTAVDSGSSYSVTVGTQPSGENCTVQDGSGTASANVTNVAVTCTTATAQGAKVERALTQTGLAIGLASTVLQSQLQILIMALTHGTGCVTLDGNGSAQYSPSASSVTIYYDSACAQQYIVMTPTVTSSTVSSGTLYNVTGSATFYGLTGSSLGALQVNEYALLPSSSTGSAQVYGLGKFTASDNPNTPVQLGLYCSVPPSSNSSTTTTLSCGGGVAQDFPSLNLAIGAVTPLTLTLTNIGTYGNGDTKFSVAFTGGGNPVSGALGSLTLTNPTSSSLVIQGGTALDTLSVNGSAGTYSLFPPTPTGWTLVDSANDRTLAVTVVSNTTLNLSLTLTQTSTGNTVASGSIDHSGTGSMSFSDGTSLSITGWTFDDHAT